MATKKRKTTTRRKTSSSPSRRKTTTKRVRRRKTGRLSEFSLSSPAMSGAVKSTFSGMLGGVTAGLIQKMTANQSTGMQIGALAVGSFLANWGLKAPNFGAGIAGAGGLLIANEIGLLSEGEMEVYDWADRIESLPMFLDENGAELLSEENDYTSGYSTALGGY